MTIVIQHNLVLGTTTSRTICDVNGNYYYFYASRRGLMLEIEYFSLLYVQFRLLIVTLKNMGRGLCCGKVLYFEL